MRLEFMDSAYCTSHIVAFNRGIVAASRNAGASGFDSHKDVVFGSKLI